MAGKDVMEESCWWVNANDYSFRHHPFPLFSSSGQRFVMERHPARCMLSRRAAMTVLSDSFIFVARLLH